MHSAGQLGNWQVTHGTWSPTVLLSSLPGHSLQQSPSSLKRATSFLSFKGIGNKIPDYREP